MQVVAGLAVPPRALAATAGRRLEVVLVLEVAERRLAGVDAQVDRAAAAAVAAVGPAARDVGLRRKVAAPSPPSPARTQILTRSRNIGAIVARGRGAAGARPAAGRRRASLEVAERVDPRAAVPDRAAPDLEVEVRAGGVAGLADAADLLAAADVLAAPDR